MDDTTLEQQLHYYRARAGEYDDWWFRTGRYDRGPEANAAWFAEVGTLEAALAAFAARGNVLELACGTGLWTRHLSISADQLTAVDGAPEVLAINRARTEALGASVTYVQADLFSWEPPRHAFDACVFAFWLSHVPEERFAVLLGDGRRSAATRWPGAVHRLRARSAIQSARSHPARRALIAGAAAAR